jgi:hypothetical protein
VRTSTSGKRPPLRRLLPPLCALVVGLVALGAAPPSHATYHVPASQAGTKINTGDGRCSLYEAIESLNAGHTAPFSGLHGCVNDEWGGSDIEVEGNGAHYKTFGAVINRWMQIFAYAPDNFAYLEHSGPSAVLTNNAGDPNTSVFVYIGGFTIQHTGTGQGRVITNTGAVYFDGCTIQNGIVTGNSGTAAYGGGIYNTGLVELFASAVQNNRAKRGGGIYTSSVPGVGLEKASVTNNSATEIGGGMYTSGRLNVETSTVSDNTATGNGGGTYCANGENSYCSFRFSTISNNRAARGGGVYQTPPTGCVGDTCNTSSTEACIIYGNKTNGGANDDYFGDPHSDDPGGGGGPDAKSLFGTFTGTINRQFDVLGNPGFGSLTNNFGMITKSRSISSTSAAKDTALANCPEQDQNFQFRPSGPACDLGAYERQQ